jgi:D-alanyl-lipoteichoic acid acyltransferase DltB (MBOAT superfamily)
MSYTIDVYRRQIRAEKSFLDYALYVTFFPQLVAGPILRAPDFLGQLKREPHGTVEDWQIGLERIARGFFKKVVVADGLATYVDVVYANPAAYGSVNQLVATYAYAFQIYCDFSGYSDIAIGLGRLFGFRFIENFRSPYIARGPSDFWQRWHISLSTWLRDYLYISMGGSRGSNLKTYRNLFLTMALGGLWHGAAWTFVIWGVYHGTWLIVHRWMFLERTAFRIPPVVSRIFTFHLVCLGWMAFRAESIQKLGIALRQLADFHTPVQGVPMDIGVLLGIAAVSHVLGAVPRLKLNWSTQFFGVKAMWYAAVIVAVFLRASSAQRFIYFQF